MATVYFLAESDQAKKLKPDFPIHLQEGSKGFPSLEHAYYFGRQLIAQRKVKGRFLNTCVQEMQPGDAFSPIKARAELVLPV